jgi:hypothetical protein
MRCLLACVPGGGEEEEGRRVAEGEGRGQRCQSEGADECLDHDVGGDVRGRGRWPMVSFAM